MHRHRRPFRPIAAALWMALASAVGVGLWMDALPPLDPVVVDSPDLNALRYAAATLDLTPAERVWERIPWTRSLEEAQALSLATGRPIFLFSMWGELDGRC